MLKDLIVSVVVPIYNSEPFLDRCIKSVVDQSYKNIEIILVNDGSTDSSANLCDYYASIDKRIKVIHKTNGGLVSSRKTGLMHSTGDYVLYIDGDDWIETSLIEDYVNEAIKNDADLVISSHIVNLEGNEEILVNSLPAGVYHKKDLLSKIYPKMLYTGKFSQFGIFSYAWGKLYKRDTLLTNQLNVSEEITMGEDALCLYPTLLKSKTLVILNKPLYHYRQRADSLIKTLRTVDVHKMQKVYSDLKKAFDDAGVLDITLNQLQYYILSLLVINTEGPNPLNSLYPFKGIKSQESLVIYGGGTFGQHLYKKITNHKKNNVVAWIDERYKGYSKLGLPVEGLDKIVTINYDRIIIALIDEDNANIAISKLLDYGVDINKITRVSYYDEKENIYNHLLEYKINL